MERTSVAVYSQLIRSVYFLSNQLWYWAACAFWFYCHWINTDISIWARLYCESPWCSIETHQTCWYSRSGGIRKSTVGHRVKDKSSDRMGHLLVVEEVDFWRWFYKCACIAVESSLEWSTCWLCIQRRGFALSIELEWMLTFICINWRYSEIKIFIRPRKCKCSCRCLERVVKIILN